MNTKIESRTSRFALGLHGIRVLSVVIVGALLLGAPSLLAGDIGMIALLKGQHYEQTGPDLVSLVAGDESGDDIPLMFTAIVQGTVPGIVTNGLLKLPDNSTVDLVYDGMDEVLGHEFGCETLFDLNVERPNGYYTFIIPTPNDGVYSNTLLLTGDQYPAMPPRVINFTALQTITNVNQEITIQWGAIPGCIPSDFIKVAIDGPFGMTWSTPEFGQPGALNGTNTSVTLTNNTLTAGHTYDVEIMVARAVDMDFSPAMALAAYYIRTVLEIHTTPLQAKFESSIPGNFVASVPVDSSVIFRFTEPMDIDPENISITWAGTGLDTNNFSYSWCDANRVLACSYPGNLPENTDITWTLNLSGFRDAQGTPLDGQPSGSFHTIPVQDEDPGVFLFKTRNYMQVADTPQIMGFNGEANVEFPAFNQIVSPVTLSNSNKLYMLEADAWYAEYYLDLSYPSQAQLDAFLPNGAYTVSLPLLEGGTNTVTMDLGSLDAYPPAPTITNLVSLQNLNSSNQIVISWTTLADFMPFPTNGYSLIEVGINCEEDGQELYWFDPGHSNITASALTIPANTLWPGRTYQVEVAFLHVVDFKSSEQGYSVAGFTAMTEFTIKTAGTPILPTPSFQSYLGGVSLLYEGGEPKRRYVIETSTDLVRWIPQMDLQSNEGATIWYQDFDAQFLPSRFYRLRDRLSTEGWVEPPVSIQGTVWTDGNHTTPVVGAQVGTSLDGQVTTTDKDGRFFLETETTLHGENPYYIINVQSTLGNRTFGPHLWGHHPRSQNFGLDGSFGPSY